MGTACATGGAADGASGTSVVPGDPAPGDNMGALMSGEVRSRVWAKAWIGAMQDNNNAAANAAQRPPPLKPRFGIAFFRSQSRQFHAAAQIYSSRT
jgi:hypothetical protein